MAQLQGSKENASREVTRKFVGIFLSFVCLSLVASMLHWHFYFSHDLLLELAWDKPSKDSIRVVAHMCSPI
jgi:hypothetical protein